MNKLTEWLTKPLIEGIDVPVEIGDTVKMGRFKNKKVVVKSIDWNEKGDLLINGRSALKFRIEKPKTEDVVPSPSRKGINKNKTNRMSGYKKVKESLPNKVKDKIKKLKDEPGSEIEKSFSGHHAGSQGSGNMGN